MISTILLTLATAIAITPVTTAAAANTTIDVRECYTTTVDLNLFPPLASWLTTQPTVTLPPSMSRHMLEHSINGTCILVDVYNWSCDHALNVTGPGLANAVRGIAEQCNGRKYSSGETAGPLGFGYYKDLDSGYDYTKHLWVLTRWCGSRSVRSACSPGA